jgi:hypothetical protein
MLSYVCKKLEVSAVSETDFTAASMKGATEVGIARTVRLTRIRILFRIYCMSILSR